MSDFNFHETIGGDEFYRGTMPRIAEASEAIGNEMAMMREDGIKIQGMDELTSAIDRLAHELKMNRLHRGLPSPEDKE